MSDYITTPMDCGPLVSSVHGVSQARVLECVAISFSRVSSWRIEPSSPSLAGRFFTTEPPGKPGASCNQISSRVLDLVPLAIKFKIGSFSCREILRIPCCCGGGGGSSGGGGASVVFDSVRPHRRQPTRLRPPWDSPGKNTGVGCHCLLQCVKSESEVAQSCPTLCDPIDSSLPGSSVHGIFQARVLEWVAIAFSVGSPNLY